MKTLIITDVQHDFMPGGALGVSHANEIIPVINRIIPKFNHVFATMDWHPRGHVSFASTHGKLVGETIKIGNVEQILWPDHCVQNTRGADLASGLHREKIEEVFHKGIDPLVDSYSAFYDSARHRSTGLADCLRKKRLKDLYFTGVATDYCVLYSVLDALELGFNVWVVKDACRAINLHEGDEMRALDQMSLKGARICLSQEI